MPGHKHKLSTRVGRAGRDIDGPGMGRPEKKARKQRPCFSCEGKSPPACHKHAYAAVLTRTCTECRRLKMKCDRQGGCYFFIYFLEDHRYVHLSPISSSPTICSHAHMLLSYQCLVPTASGDNALPIAHGRPVRQTARRQRRLGPLGPCQHKRAPSTAGATPIAQPSSTSKVHSSDAQQSRRRHR